MATPDSAAALPPTGTGQLPVQSEQVLEALPWGVLLLTANGTVAYLNTAAATLWGVSASAAVGHRPAEVLPAVLPLALVQALEQPPLNPAEYWLPHTGQWISQRTAPAPGGQRWLFWDNVTARKQAETAQQRSHELLLGTIDSSLDMVQVFEAVRDEQGAVVDFMWVLNNAASERLYGNVIGQRLLQLNPGVVEVGIFDTFKQVLETGMPNQAERHYVHEQFDGWFYQSVVKLNDGVATTTRDITELKQSQAEALTLHKALLQQATDQYQTLFHFMDEGFCVMELVFDEEQVVDYYYREVNPAFARQSGLSTDALGKSIRELIPDLDTFWFDTYRQVARTGEPARVEQYIPQLSRWFDVRTFRVGGAGSRQVAALFNDITAHKQAQEQLRHAAAAETFRLQLADALGPLTDSAAIQEAVTHATRLHFGATRCYYCEIEAGQAIIRCDSGAAGLPSVAGTYPLTQLTLLQTGSEAGRPSSVRDVRQNEPTDEALRQLCVRLEVLALLQVPVIKEGQPAGVLCLGQNQPRDWTAAETALALEVAERTWAAVERARTEAALRESEEKYRTLFETMEQGFGIGEALPADEAAGVPMDWQWLEVNPQFERLTGLNRAAVLGHTMRQLLPGLDEIWYERYGHVAATGETVSFEAFSPVLDSWFDVYAFALGTPVMRRVAVLFTNTTARKRAEVALREAEARYREQLEGQVTERTRELQQSRDLLQSVFDTNLIAMSVMEAVRDDAGTIQDFRLRLVSGEVIRETGRTDLEGKLYGQEYPGIYEAGIFELAVRAVETGEPQSMEYYYPHEGFHKWFASQFVKLGDGAVATNLDITERKTAEQDQLKNLRLLEQAEAVAGLGSWDYDLATGIMHWSDGMYHLFGLPVGSPAEPSRYLAVVLDEDRPQAEQLVSRLTAGEGFEATLRLRTSGRTKTVRMKAVVLRDEAGQPVRVLGVDLEISELLRLEADNLHLRLNQQRALFEAVQAAQEAERKRIAEGLHNGVGQTLYATKLQFDQLRPVLPSEAWQRSTKLLADAIRQTRAISHELVPMVLNEFGLEPALTDICRALHSSRLRFSCDVDLSELTQPLPASLQLAVYRMAQELVQNIVKHAHATEANLTLEAVPGFLLLRAEDNGVGFPVEAPEHRGLGLRSIRDRVALLGGTVDMGSAPSVGTYVRLRLPLPSA